MAINKKLIYIKTESRFNTLLNNNEIDEKSIVFIEDSKRVWTHGVFFDTSWDYVTGKPNTFTPSAHTLGSHSDVTLAALANGNILRYDGSKWVNNTLAQAGIATPADITNAINGIEIGGRNLLLDTFDLSKIQVYASRGTIVSRGNKSYTIIPQKDVNAGVMLLFSETLKSDTEYTLAFDVESNITTTLNYLSLRYNGSWTVIGGSMVKLPNQNINVGLNSIKITFNTGSSGNINSIWNAISSPDDLELTYSNLRLMEGNKATDWTPAPEDQVSDWNTTDVTSFSYIKNKPTTFTPSAHSHGPITNDGKIGTLADRIIETTTGGLLTHVAKNTAYNKDFGTTAGTVAQGNDSRIINGQTAFGWGDFRTYGLGTTAGAVITDDMNTPVTNALFSANASSPTNSPTGQSYPMGINFYRSAAVRAQISIGHQALTGIAYRGYSGSWKDWVKVWDENNLTKLTQLTNDLPNFTRTVAGLVPAPGATTTTRYLREDGTWVTPPNTPDTHWTTGIRAGASGTNSNSVADDPFIKVLDNTTYRSQIRLVGSGATSISSDASGNITISSTNTDTTYTTGTLAQLNAGTDTTGRLQTAKLLNDWLNPKLNDKFDKTGGRLTTGTGDVSIELWRGTNASWNILNSGGYLRFQSNYTTVVGAYFDALKLDYNTGNALFKGTVTAPTFIGALTGNATTATKLQTARTIWGQSFDGTGDISGGLTVDTVTSKLIAASVSDTYEVNLSLASTFVLTMSGNTSFSFINFPGNNKTITILIKLSGNYNWVFPNTLKRLKSVPYDGGKQNYIFMDINNNNGIIEGVYIINQQY